MNPDPSPELDADADRDLEAAIRHAVRALTEARRPLILAGRGARLAGAASELSGLAADLGALTCTSLLATGLFDERRYDLGVAGGFAHADVRAVIGQADTVLVAGARLNPFQMHFGDLLAPEATVVQIDRLQRGRHLRADVFVQADVRDAVREIRVRVAPRPQEASWRHEAELPTTDRHDLWSADDVQTVVDADPGGVQDRPADHVVAAYSGDDDRLDPRGLARALEDHLPADRLLLQDLGNFVEWMPTRTRLPGPGRVMMLGSAFQSIGLGLPGVVGAAHAVPGSTVVLATGDGGLLMALADLESVVREAASAVVVVFNDAAYGAELHQYAAYGVGAAPMLIPDVSFAALAQALGAAGATVRSVRDLDALSDWVRDGSRGTLVLDCKVSRRVVGPVLAGIAQGIARPAADVGA